MTFAKAEGKQTFSQLKNLHFFIENPSSSTVSIKTSLSLFKLKQFTQCQTKQYSNYFLLLLAKNVFYYF